MQAIAEPPSPRGELKASVPLAVSGLADESAGGNCDPRTCEEDWDSPASSSAPDQGPPELSSLEDNLWTFLLISPLVVSFWRGGWELMDALFFPGAALLFFFASCSSCGGLGPNHLFLGRVPR